MPVLGSGDGSPLITVDNPDIYAISVSQSPGQLAPAFNVQIFPHNARPEATWFSYEPPELVVSIGGISYTCLPEQQSVVIDPDQSGVTIEVQYYPQAVIRLQNLGLKKNLVFLSCLPYEFELLEEEYDEDHYEVLHKSCDVYTSDGWTVQEILAEIATRAGITISTQFPTFHTPNPTVILQRGQAILPFIKSLLPADFDYTWTLVGDAVSVSLAQPVPSSGITFIPGMFTMERSKRSVPAYDFVEIRGGEYKWGETRVDLGGAVGLGAKPYYQNGQTVLETLPEESQTTSEGTKVTSVTRQYLTGPDGEEFFALLNRTTAVNLDGDEISHVEEAFSYENLQPNVYRQPRQTQIVTTRKVPYCTVVTGQAAAGDGVAYLTVDARVLTSSEYADLSDAPTVLCSATQTYGATVETITETFEWVTPETADKNWPEGTQRAHTRTVTRRFVDVDGRYYSAALAPRGLLQAVLTDMGTKELELSTPSVSVADKTQESLLERLDKVSQGAFQQHISRSLYDVKQDTMQENSAVQTVNGRPSGNPSVYRTEPLIATLAGQGTGGASFKTGVDTCIPFQAEIMTNNPTDFRLWVGLLWQLKIRGEQAVSASSFSRLLPMGFTIGGVTFTSFQANQDGQGTQSVVMGGI